MFHGAELVYQYTVDHEAFDVTIFLALVIVKYMGKNLATTKPRSIEHIFC